MKSRALHGGAAELHRPKTTSKIKEIESKIADLQRMKASLEKLSNACDASQDDIRQFKVQECFDFGPTSPTSSRLEGHMYRRIADVRILNYIWCGRD